VFYLFIGAGHIIKKLIYFSNSIQNVRLHLDIIFIHYTQTDIIQVFIPFHFDDYNRQLMKIPKSESQKLRKLSHVYTKLGIEKQILFDSTLYC